MSSGRELIVLATYFLQKVENKSLPPWEPGEDICVYCEKLAYVTMEPGKSHDLTDPIWRLGRAGGVIRRPKAWDPGERWCLRTINEAGKKGWISLSSSFFSTQALNGLDHDHPDLGGQTIFYFHQFKCISQLKTPSQTETMFSPGTSGLLKLTKLTIAPCEGTQWKRPCIDGGR